ncbi:MAG: outer membrane beta-barrel protein [Chitinophagaceae bacterium]|nr:outer membrane beta-barrel protein [Chitinophagaceae bacterium]
MKRILTIIGLVYLSFNANAQKDTTAVPENDTIRVGNMIIIRSGKDRNNSHFDPTEKIFKSKNPNITTNWVILDLGFNQVNDKTNYAQAIADGTLPAGANGDWFNQRNFKSTNVNIWIFMQRLNMIKHIVNLKYGVGLELNNYKYTENIRYQKSGNPVVIMDNVDYSKNKLAADYITIPLMLNFNFDPHDRKNSYGFSIGVSGGYLYSSRQKTKGGGTEKVKYHDDFGLRDFKLAYVAELGFGPIKLYGSYATQSMFENGLDQTPYSFGIRISNP